MFDKKLLTVDSTTSNCNIIRLVYIEQVHCGVLMESYFNDYLCDIFFSDFILLHNFLGCHCQEKNCGGKRVKWTIKDPYNLCLIIF